MSWTAYVESMIANSGGHLSKGCIIGLEGGVWTAGADEKLLQITAAEAGTIAGAMKTKDSAEIQKRFVEKGIIVEDKRYMFIRDMQGDGSCIVGKKAGFGGLTIQRTNMAVVIGFTPEGKEQRAATSAVNTIVDYLLKSNY